MRKQPIKPQLQHLNIGYRVKIHVRKNSVGGWSYEFRWREGKICRRSTQRTQDLDEVREIREIVEKTVREKVFKLKKLYSILNLSEFIDRYLAYCREKNVSDNYLRQIGLRFKKLSKHFNIIDTPLISLKSKDLSNYIQTELNSGRKPRGVATDYRIIRAAFNWAVRQNWLNDNPMDDVDPPKMPRILPKRFNLVEIRRILGIIDREDDRVILSILLFTGMRISELLNLQWNDIDLESGVIIIIGKGGHEREIFISSYLRRILEGLKRFDGTDLVLPGIILKKGHIPVAKGKKSYSRLRSRFQRYFERAGIKNKGGGVFHRFRHTFGSMLGDAGHSSFELKQLLGHSSVKTSEIYTWIGSDVLKTAVEDINKEIWKRIQI